MARLTTVQAAHSYGVLDPLVIERRDTKFVGGSLSDGRNIVILPQGGYTHRGGSTDRGRARRPLAAVAFTGTELSLPNGGSEGDFLAGADVTITGATGTRYELAVIEFGVATNVAMIDVKEISAVNERADAIVAEWWNGSAWQAFGSPARITRGALTRRIASGAPGHAGHTATKFRLAIDTTAGATGDVTLTGMALWTESSTLGDGIVRRYAPEQGQAHQLVITPGNIDVFEAGTWRAAIAYPATADNLRTIKQEAKFNSILAFHHDMRPQEILRLEDSAEWSCDGIVFRNVPLVDYGGVYTNGVNEVQEIQIYDIAEGQQFDLALEGETTTAIARGASGAATAASITAALEALTAVDAGLTVVNDSTTKFTVTFTGGDNAERNWLQMIGTALDGNGFVRVRTITQGKAPGEDIVSNARGWPAVGRFAQQRLVMAGLKSRPNEVLASVTGQPYDLNTSISVATAALSYGVDASENNGILDIIIGRVPIFMGDEQVVYLKNQTLSATEVPQFGVSDSPGIKSQAGITSSDNAIYYVQGDGTTLRQLSYTELEQNFVSENASVLSAHLIRQPTELFRRRAQGKVNSDLLMMINEDGTITTQTVMRAQEVSGFVGWETDGEWKSGMVDHDNVVWTLAEREVNGVTELRLESMDPEKLLDEAVEGVFESPSDTITGLSRFNGRTVWCVADDAVFGPFEVSGGEIELDEPVTAWRVGTWVAPLAKDPPIKLEEETRGRHARLKRVNRAVLSVFETTSLAIAVNDGDTIDLPLRSNAETITDTAPLADPVTGEIEAEGMHGFSRHGQITVTQTVPGALTVRSVTKNIVA